MSRTKESVKYNRLRSLGVSERQATKLAYGIGSVSKRKPVKRKVGFPRPTFRF